MEVVDWARATISLAAVWSLVVIARRYIQLFSDMSTGQKLYIGSIVFFLLGFTIATGYNIRDGVGFRWSLIPTTIAIMLTFAYSLEPIERTRKRLGRDPFDPRP